MRMNMFLDKLKEFPKNRTLIISTIIAYIPFIIITIFVYIFNEIALEVNTGFGVLDFELAWTSDQINQIFTAWGAAEMERQAIVTWIDYIYIISYSIFGFLAVLVITRRFGGNLQKIGLYMTFATTIAGIFDAFENINLLLMLYDPIFISSICPLLATICAVFKISFLGLGIGALYGGSIYVMIGRDRTYLLYIFLIGGGVMITVMWALWSILIAFLSGMVYFGVLFALIAGIKMNKITLE
jgi:hypothetical protein